MIFFVFLVFCIGVSLGNYGVPPAQSVPSYGPSYGGSGYDMGPEPYDYYSKEDHHRKKDQKKSYRKLKQLIASSVSPAVIDYYRYDDNVFALITCLNNPNANHLSWIMADSDVPFNPSIINGVIGTIPLSGGINNTYTVKYERKSKKWSGEDFFEYKTRKFERVGCFYSGQEKIRFGSPAFTP